MWYKIRIRQYCYSNGRSFLWRNPPDCLAARFYNSILDIRHPHNNLIWLTLWWRHVIIWAHCGLGTSSKEIPGRIIGPACLSLFHRFNVNTRIILQGPIHSQWEFIKILVYCCTLAGGVGASGLPPHCILPPSCSQSLNPHLRVVCVNFP